MDILRRSSFANFPTHMDIFPGSRAVGFIRHAMRIIFFFKDFFPEVVGVLIEPLFQTGQHSGTPNGSFLEAQDPIGFNVSQGLAVD